MKKKNVYIVAGPNGSGKTTFAKEFLPNFVKNYHFINADLIAIGLSPFFPQKASLKAGRLVIEQIGEYTTKGVDFGFESTLAGKVYLKHFEKLKAKGYRIHMYFLWVPGTALAIERIKDRVIEGGHHVPSTDVKRRYKRSLHNFFKLYLPLADTWMVFNNAGLKPEKVVSKTNAHLDVYNDDLFQKILKDAGVKL